MFTTEYIKAFQTLSKKALKGKTAVHPFGALDGWKELIEEIEDGYSWVAPELHNDLDNSRTYIQELIESKELIQFPEHNHFIRLINELDDKFRELSIENPKWHSIGYWWHQRLLKKGTIEYLKMVKGFYHGIGFEPEEIKY